MFIRGELAEERYRMFISVYILCFSKVEKNQILKLFLYFIHRLLILFVSLKKKIFLRFCLRIFESGTVKTDCPVRKLIKYLKIQYRLLVYLTSFAVFFRNSGEIKKKKL